MIGVSIDAEFMLYSTTEREFKRAEYLFDNIFENDELLDIFEREILPPHYELSEYTLGEGLEHTEIGVDGDCRLLEIRPYPSKFTPREVAKRLKHLLEVLNSLLSENIVVLRTPAGFGYAGAHIHLDNVPEEKRRSVINQLDLQLQVPLLAYYTPFPLYLKRYEVGGWGEFSAYRVKGDGHFEYRSLNNHFSSQEVTKLLLNKTKRIAEKAIRETPDKREPIDADPRDLNQLKSMTPPPPIFSKLPPKSSFFEDVLVSFGIRDREESKEEIEQRIRDLIKIDGNWDDFWIWEIAQEVRVRSNYQVYLFGLRQRKTMHPNGDLPDIKIYSDRLDRSQKRAIIKALPRHKVDFLEMAGGSNKIKIGLARKIRDDTSYAAEVVDRILINIGDIIVGE